MGLGWCVEGVGGWGRAEGVGGAVTASGEGGAGGGGAAGLGGGFMELCEGETPGHRLHVLFPPSCQVTYHVAVL